MGYSVVYEQGDNNWSAYSPDVPGCVAAAKTIEELEILFKEALEFHIEGILAVGDPMPTSHTRIGKVLVKV